MRECSLHMDFADDQGNLKQEKMDRLFAMAQKLGIHTFNTYGDQAVYPDEDENEQKFVEELSQSMAKAGMKLSSFHFIGSVLDVEDPEQKRVRHYMDRALALYSPLNPGVFVVHPGTFSDGGFKKNKLVHQQALEQWGPEKTHQLIVENLRYFGKQAQAYGIRIAVENIYGGRFYSQIDELIGLVDDVNVENVGFCLDVGHANLDHVNIPEAVARMGSRLYEVHLHDNNGLKDQHLPIGFGIINWIEVISALNKIEYPGTATFEFFRWPLSDQETGIARAVELWKALESVEENGYWTKDWI